MEIASCNARTVIGYPSVNKISLFIEYLCILDWHILRKNISKPTYIYNKYVLFEVYQFRKKANANWKYQSLATKMCVEFPASISWLYEGTYMALIHLRQVGERDMWWVVPHE